MSGTGTTTDGEPPKGMDPVLFYGGTFFLSVVGLIIVCCAGAKARNWYQTRRYRRLQAQAAAGELNSLATSIGDKGDATRVGRMEEGAAGEGQSRGERMKKKLKSTLKLQPAETGSGAGGSGGGRKKRAGERKSLLKAGDDGSRGREDGDEEEEEEDGRMGMAGGKEVAAVQLQLDGGSGFGFQVPDSTFTFTSATYETQWNELATIAEQTVAVDETGDHVMLGSVEAVETACERRNLFCIASGDTQTQRRWFMYGLERRTGLLLLTELTLDKQAHQLKVVVKGSAPTMADPFLDMLFGLMAVSR